MNLAANIAFCASRSPECKPDPEFPKFRRQECSVSPGATHRSNGRCAGSRVVNLYAPTALGDPCGCCAPLGHSGKSSHGTADNRNIAHLGV